MRPKVERLMAEEAETVYLVPYLWWQSKERGLSLGLSPAPRLRDAGHTGLGRSTITLGLRQLARLLYHDYDVCPSPHSCSPSVIPHAAVVRDLDLRYH